MPGKMLARAWPTWSFLLVIVPVMVNVIAQVVDNSHSHGHSTGLTTSSNSHGHGHSTGQKSTWIVIVKFTAIAVAIPIANATALEDHAYLPLFSLILILILPVRSNLKDTSLVRFSERECLGEREATE